MNVYYLYFHPGSGIYSKFNWFGQKERMKKQNKIQMRMRDVLMKCYCRKNVLLKNGTDSKDLSAAEAAFHKKQMFL